MKQPGHPGIQRTKAHTSTHTNSGVKAPYSTGQSSTTFSSFRTISWSRSLFVADPSQQVFAPFDPGLVLDALAAGTVHHAEDAASLFGFRDDDLGRRSAVSSARRPIRPRSLPRPCSVSATTTSVGLAVAQKTRQTSGTILTVFNTFSG